MIIYKFAFPFLNVIEINCMPILGLYNCLYFFFRSSDQFLDTFSCNICLLATCEPFLCQTDRITATSSNCFLLILLYVVDCCLLQHAPTFHITTQQSKTSVLRHMIETFDLVHKQCLDVVKV